MAVTFTAINAIFLMLTKGRHFSDKYADISCKNYFSKVYGIEKAPILFEQFQSLGVAFENFETAFKNFAGAAETEKAAYQEHFNECKKKFKSAFVVFFSNLLRTQGITPHTKISPEDSSKTYREYLNDFAEVIIKNPSRYQELFERQTMDAETIAVEAPPVTPPAPADHAPPPASTKTWRAWCASWCTTRSVDNSLEDPLLAEPAH
jgi:hypothetical protein